MGGRSRQTSEFEASLVYRMSPRTARAPQRNPVSKNKTKQNKTKTKSCVGDIELNCVKEKRKMESEAPQARRVLPELTISGKTSKMAPGTRERQQKITEAREVPAPPFSRWPYCPLP